MHIPSLSSKRLNFSCLLPHLQRRNDMKSYLVKLWGGSDKQMHIQCVWDTQQHWVLAQCKDSAGPVLAAWFVVKHLGVGEHRDWFVCQSLGGRALSYCFLGSKKKKKKKASSRKPFNLWHLGPRYIFLVPFSDTPECPLSCVNCLAFLSWWTVKVQRDWTNSYREQNIFLNFHNSPWLFENSQFIFKNSQEMYIESATKTQLGFHKCSIEDHKLSKGTSLSETNDHSLETLYPPPLPGPSKSFSPSNAQRLVCSPGISSLIHSSWIKRSSFGPCSLWLGRTSIMLTLFYSAL